jgi:hypothetical protein
MQFFLLMPGDSEEDTLNEANLLGESSFGNFWAGTALKTLMNVVDKDPELLPMMKIRTDMSNKIFSIEEFLTVIQKLKIRMR